MEKNDTPLNRIILIGNGFDIAHGMKTKYKDFIENFWMQQYEEANHFNEWKIVNGRFFFENNFFELESPQYKKYTDISSLKGEITRYKNNFLERIEQVRIILNWVDLEELYYRELLNCLKIEKVNNDAYVVSPIKKLNEDFNCIKDRFNAYLTNKIKIGEKIDEIDGHIRKGMNKGGKILFLNFNYTNTETLYFIEEKDDIIHIHGEIDPKAENPIIFGYGDELAVDFKDIENTNRNEFLENAKSIKYLETDNYDRLLEFIDKGAYEVFIFGHSCGNSDRTLLNTIFEHPNCKKIKPFYHQKSATEDDFSEITKNISRNFTGSKDSKSNLRKLVEKKKGCVPLYYEGKIKSDLEEFLNDKFVEIDGEKVGYKLIKKGAESASIAIGKYRIGKLQVTQEFYMQIMGVKNPSHFNGPESEEHPVENVSWYDCLKFCNALSDKYKLTPYYKYTEEKDIEIHPYDYICKDENGEPANGFRLPTEAEWEYAAVGGMKALGKKLNTLKITNEYNNLTKDDYEKLEKKLYAGYLAESDDEKTVIEKLKEYAWFGEDWDEGSTHIVGKKTPNELGICDMSGNVWEWCEDWYSDHHSNRVLRGGSWSNYAGSCSVANRGYGAPGNRSNGFGFRLAVSL